MEGGIMPDDHLADIEEQRVKHEPLDARNDKLTTSQAGRTRGKGRGRLMCPSYATLSSDELDGPYQPIRERGVGNWLWLVYEAELALNISEEEKVRSVEEENFEGLDIEAEQDECSDDGYGRKKHPSVRGRLGCDASYLENVDEGEENGKEIHGK